MSKIRVALLTPILLPLMLLLTLTSRTNPIFADLNKWSEVYDRKPLGDGLAFLGPFCRFMTYYPEFRSILYYRLKPARLMSFLLKPMPTLYIHTKDIGPGLFIQHGFATIITAKKIGSNCWINQQVTIGYGKHEDAPTLGDDVTVSAGAIVIGAVKIGDGARVGAGAVVTKDVETQSVVVGVPARRIGAAAAAQPEKVH